MHVPHSHNFDDPRRRSPNVCLGRLRFSTAASASTIISDDMSSTNVDAEVTGIFRMGLSAVAHTGGLHASCGNGPTTVSYTHLRAHETGRNLVCRLLLEKKK